MAISDTAISSARVVEGGPAALVDALREHGYVIVGPVARDGVVTLAEIGSADDLPAGWRDTQDPGRYRAEFDDSPTRFVHAAPAQPWKRWLHPERTLLVRTRTTDGATAIDGPVSQVAPLAFVGMQACDLAALAKLDVVLAHDEGYQERRAGLFVAAVACTTPASTCFCVSAGTGPMPGAGADVVMAELDDATLLMAAHSTEGERLLGDIGAAGLAAAHLIDGAVAAVEAGAAAQSRKLDQRAVDAAAAHPDHPGWEDIATACLTCGNCTFVCPTCFCTSVEDANLLDGSGFERSQRWDSCFSIDFSYVHGGPVRPGAASRYRQWYLHKLVTWHDQFGSSGCVGCGRCITWCPTGIDITKAVIT